MNLGSAPLRYDPSQENQMRRIVERAIDDLTVKITQRPVTGWGVPTGTQTTTTFDTATVTVSQLAERVHALIELLRRQGTISA